VSERAVWLAEVDRARQGDLDAFDALVSRFRDMAVGYAYAVLGDFHAAQDAAQEAFIQAYLDFEDLREPAAFPAWLRRIVFRQCDRHTRRRRPVLVGSGESLDVADEAVETDPPAAAERHEQQRYVLGLVGSLPEKERTAATLYYINGYSLAEVGEFLDVPVTTVKNRVHSARRRLRKGMVSAVQDTLREHAPGDDLNRKVRRVLEGVPRVGFYRAGDVCPEDITFPSSLAAVLRYLGEDYPWLPLESHGKQWRLNYANVFLLATSGMSFGLIWREGWGPENTDLMLIAAEPHDVLRPAFAAAGYEYELVEAPGAEADSGEEQAFRRRVMGSLDSGRPVLAWGVLGPPECCVLTGYDDDGQVVMGWNFFAELPEWRADCEIDGGTGYFRRRDWVRATDRVVLIGDRLPTMPPATETLRRTLRLAVGVAHRGEVNGRAVGLAAWDAWRRQILRDDELEPGLLQERHGIHHSQVGTAAELRAWAAHFLWRMVEETAPPAAVSEPLRAAAERFMGIHDLMWEVWRAGGGWDNPEAHLTFAETGVRQTIAAMLEQARDRDAEAMLLLERALAAMGEG